MADIFKTPTKQEVEELRGLLGDPLLHSLIKSLCRTLDEETYHKSCETLWYSLTRQMFKNYPTATVYELVERASEEASDKQWFENKYPPEIFEEHTLPTPKHTSEIVNKITKKVSIIALAEKFGIEVRNKKAKCPFHEDTNPSLSLNEEKGLFHCFGCGISGNIIKFYALLKKLYPSKKVIDDKQNNISTPPSPQFSKEGGGS